MQGDLAILLEPAGEDGKEQLKPASEQGDGKFGHRLVRDGEEGLQ